MAPVSILQDADINLNGHRIEAAISSALFNANGATLTLKGNGTVRNSRWIANATNGGKVVIESGNYISGYEAFKAIGEGSAVQMDGGHITSQETAISANQGGIIEMNGGLIETIDNFGLATNGSAGQGGNTIIMNGGKIDAHITSAGYEACAVYIANEDIFVMNDGELIANNGAGICMRAGDVEINGGTITATGEAGTTGKIGDGKFQMGKSGIIYHESANYPGKEGMRLTVKGGSVTGVDHAIEILSNETEPQVFVTGGTFVPEWPETAPNEEPEEETNEP